MKICKFKKTHIDKLEITKEEKAEMLEYYELYLKDESPAFTIKYQGMVEGIGGVRLIDKRAGEAWMCFNRDFLHFHKKRLILKIRDMFAFVGIIFNLNRIQAIIDVGSARDKRFIEFLGFKYEKKLETGFDLYVKG